ncbi:hypothetical protein ACT0UZ_000802 [Pseudomonas aeruginosa]
MSKELNKAPVEQVGGDERAAFEAAFAAMGRPVCRADYDQDAYGTPFDDGGWTGWQARAALAQPSGEVVVTKNESGAIVSVTRQDKEGRVLSVIAESATLTAQAEQAEAERPEVIRVPSCENSYGFGYVDGSCHVDLRKYRNHLEDILDSLPNDEPLMTISQHDRIVGELRADRDSWAEQAEQRLADWDEMRKERDAALVRVEQQERTIAGMNEAHAKLAGLYEAAQAQHSVPEDIMRDAQRYRWLRDQQFYFSFSTENSDAGISSCTAGMSSRFKNLSWVDAAIDSAIAAAPGKEGV